MSRRTPQAHRYNGAYQDSSLDRLAFPLGGVGAGMLCMEGCGALSQISLRHRPEVQNEPLLFSALHLKGVPDGTRLLEGPVPGWKILHPWSGESGRGAGGKSYGLPRFASARMLPRFPFARLCLDDPGLPVEVEIEAWSPFIPGAADDSSLPVAALEFRFRNLGDTAVEAIYSFHSRNFMAVDAPKPEAGCCGQGSAPEPAAVARPRGVRALPGGFVLWEPAKPGRPFDQGAFAAWVPEEEVAVNAAWFRGGWYDPLSMLWRDLCAGEAPRRGDLGEGAPSPGGSLAVPFTLEGRGERRIRLLLGWHVPRSDLRLPKRGSAPGAGPCCSAEAASCYEPWYASRYPDVDAVISGFQGEYQRLREESARFRDAFFASTLPPELTEAVAANLAILKSPTVLRQKDGRLWCFEGCDDSRGCCEGSCTHVWNYAQAIPHLFPSLERTLRETEFGEGQADSGHQAFRVPLPIRPASHDAFAASDGQLGGIIKMYRDWRISGDLAWLRRLWPRVRSSLEYCIRTWDPRRRGVLEEPHHNTYDIEFWGADGMCTSFYLAALEAAARMGEALGDDVADLRQLLERGLAVLEKELWNGEYFIQKITWTGLDAGDPADLTPLAGEAYGSPEALELLRREGPKYQYGEGCLSDGVLGFWRAAVSGIDGIGDRDKVASHLRSVFRYNFRQDLSRHANPQRPAYAVGLEAGLLLCSWPRGGELSLPFPYAKEVWTGIEYQVASHLMMSGMVEEGLAIVRAVRDRYDGTVRNPFDEIECGHWYARAMSSYGLIQGITGVRYDAVTRVLTVHPCIPGDFRSFLCTATGYGHVGVESRQVLLEVVAGTIAVDRLDYVPFTGRERP